MCYENCDFEILVVIRIELKIYKQTELGDN